LFLPVKPIPRLNQAAYHNTQLGPSLHVVENRRFPEEETVRRIAILILLLPVLLLPTQCAWAHSDDYVTVRHDCSLDHVDLDFEGKTIVLTYHDHRDARVEITEDYELYVNGVLVVTDEDQRKLVSECYLLTMEIVAEAGLLGIKGAQIGVEGACLGIKGLGGVLKMLFTSYDDRDFERDMERAARELERKAERLERRAEDIEQAAERLEFVYSRMEREIPELRELD
jgi:hypothetical protein